MNEQQPEGLTLNIEHTEDQQTDLRKYFTQFGRNLRGFAYLVQRNDVNVSADVVSQHPLRPAGR